MRNLNFILPSILLFAFLLPFSVFSQNTQEYPDDTLIRAENDYKVYTVFNGKKRWVKNIDVFNSYGYKWEDIKVVNPAVVKNIELSNLVRGEGDVKVYALNDNGYKRHIINPAVFESYGFEWNDIADVSSEEITNYPESLLIRKQGDPKVYFLENGKRRWVESPESFYIHDFSWDEVHIVNDVDINFHEDGEVVTPESTIKRATPATPAQPAEPAEPATPAQPGQGATSTIPATPAEPAEPATPATPPGQEPEPDTTPPVISNIQTTNITEDSATVTWTTDELSDSKVSYVKVSPITSTTTIDVVSTTSTTSHAINLTGLSASTTYYYVVSSIDSSDNTATSSEQSFTTLLPITTCGASNPTVAIVQDNFNTYTDGSIVGQGNWNSYVNGGNFIVQGTTVAEGTKALYNNTPADSVITKAGTPLSDGRQAVCVRTENRSNWGTYADGNAQFRVTKGPWASGAPGLAFAAVSFKRDGNVAYYDPVNDVYQNFATYNDSEWTLLEIEWRSSDKTARYRVNNGAWSSWHTFSGSASFTDFDHVGFDFISPSGSGGVYFDTLTSSGEDSQPSPQWQPSIVGPYTDYRPDILPGKAWNGSEYGTVWHDPRDGAGADIYFAKEDQGGNKLTSDIQITSSTTSDSLYPKIAWNGSEFGIVWQDDRDGYYKLYFARVSNEGVKLTGDIKIVDGATQSGGQQIIWTGSRYAVVYYNGDPGVNEIHLALVGSGGTVEKITQVSHHVSAHSELPSMVWTGSEFGISWHDAGVYFAKFNANGDKIGEEIKLTDIGAYTTVSFDGSLYTVTWNNPDGNTYSASGK